MEFFHELLSKITHNKGKELKNKPHGFTVIREPFKSWDGTLHAESCPPGEFAFTVVPGINFSKKIANIASILAVEKTRKKKLYDDLDDVGELDSNTPIADLFRLAHALEHLTVIDLIEREIVHIPENGIVESGAITIAYPRSDEKSVDGMGVSFYVKKDLASDDEQLISLHNAINAVNNLLKPK